MTNKNVPEDPTALPGAFDPPTSVTGKAITRCKDCPAWDEFTPDRPGRQGHGMGDRFTRARALEGIVSNWSDHIEGIGMRGVRQEADTLMRLSAARAIWERKPQ